MIKLEKLEKGEFFEDAFLVSYRYNNLVGSLILDLSPEDQIKAIEGRLEVKKNNNNEGGGSSDGAGDSTRVF